MLKKYHNRHIGIPRINRRLRRLLMERFPELDKYRRKHDPFRLHEALFYILRTGCQWRLLPACYPHWKSVYNKWRYWISGLTLNYPTLSEMRADNGYQGEDITGVATSHGLILRCTKSNGRGKLFIPAQGRWIVERTFSWLDNFRRLARNYERQCRTATNMVLTAEIYRLLRFL